MTKEEFKQGWLSHVRKPNYPQKTIDLMNKDFNDMLDFENKELTERLAEKETELLDELMGLTEENKNLHFLNDVLEARVNELESKLTELKEKHKRDVIEAYKDGMLNITKNNLDKYYFLSPEKYYKETHENEN